MRSDADYRRADRGLCRVARFRHTLQGVAEARPTGVEGGIRRGITRRDIVENEDVGGTFRIATVFLIQDCGYPAHAGLDLRDQAAKVGCDQLTAIGVRHRDVRRRASEI